MVSPAVLGLVALLGGCYWYIGRAYRVSARDMRRAVTVAKSPLLAHFVEVGGYV